MPDGALQCMKPEVCAQERSIARQQWRFRVCCVSSCIHLEGGNHLSCKLKIA